ncbi:MAG: hypothetical protein LBK58_04550 [Prevotellaceae bacterium]|jgi:hypothetical protein|nr:hypothetical protein [Prevotellaceae bacterium]
MRQDIDKYGFSTRAIQAGEDLCHEEKTSGDIVTPIYLTARYARGAIRRIGLRNTTMYVRRFEGAGYG